MNIEIRLFDTPRQNGSLSEFLADFTDREVLEYLRQAFNIAVEEFENGMIPIEQVELMFDLAEVLFGMTDKGDKIYREYIRHLLILKT